MTRIEAVISDFGGVLTSPLIDSFTAFQETEGISLEHLGQAMATVALKTGKNPLFELEKGRLSEAEFLRSLADVLTEQLGEPVTLHEFGQRYFEHLESNPPMIDYMRELKRRGYRLAICTNNVREWEDRWRSMLPVDEIFEVVVDSGFVGTRKPEPEIYEITLQRLGVEPARALFVDDVELNCQGARELGLSAVWFQSTEQAIEEIDQALAAPTDQFSAPSRSQQ
jgi:putative hydrolase of the HAD superfamily